MKKCQLGPQLSVWIMLVSIFSSVHINRFHCSVFSSINRLSFNYITAIYNRSITNETFNIIYSYAVHYESLNLVSNFIH